MYIYIERERQRETETEKERCISRIALQCQSLIADGTSVSTRSLMKLK